MNHLPNETIGFIGLGLMGRPMAMHLHQAGYSLVIYNRSTPVVTELSAFGMVAAESPRDVARQTTIIIVMVSDTTATEAVLLSDEGVAQGVQSGALVIDMGTTAVAATRRFAQEMGKLGADYLDAPVSGGQVGAQQAALTIMAGGSEPAFARAKPVFATLGGHVTRVGDVGAGQVAKAANQIIVGLTIGAVAEALTLAKKAGVDPAKVRAAFEGGFAWSRIMELHGQRMIDAQFTPGAKTVTQRKDLAQALVLAEQIGLDLPATRLNRDLYDQLIEQGGGELDHSALVTVIDT
jgi:3-hydroxyisobutyrate dehydrogenase-like beta-hydroxyacid dehydrogenase